MPYCVGVNEEASESRGVAFWVSRLCDCPYIRCEMFWSLCLACVEALGNIDLS